MPNSSIPTVVTTPVRSTSLARHLPVALKWLLSLTLALAPLPLASARPLAWSVLAVAIGALLLLSLGCEFIERTPSAATSVLRIPAALGALIAAWIVAQSLPLGDLVRLSPLWGSAAQALGSAVQPSISLDREDSISHLLRLLAYGGSFLIAWRVARRSDGAQTILRAIGVIGAAYSLYGLAVYFSGNASILWFSKWAFRTDLTGTFVNRNSFATFIGLGLIANLALMAGMLAEKTDARSWRTLLQSSVEVVLWRGGWTTACLVVIGSALLFTHSRGGSLAAMLGASALVLCVIGAPSLRGRWSLSFAVVTALGAIVILAVDGSGFLNRIGYTVSDSGVRIDIVSGTLKAIVENPIFGTGLGSFKYVYAPYQPPAIGLLVDLAHNDYLENILELGLPFAIMFYSMLLLLISSCLRGVLRRRRNAIYCCAGVGASVLVAGHATVDFSMQAPAVAVIYAALLGIGVAQSVGLANRDHGNGSRSRIS
jgi:O-antigen ligase